MPLTSCHGSARVLSPAMASNCPSGATWPHEFAHGQVARPERARVGQGHQRQHGLRCSHAMAGSAALWRGRRCLGIPGHGHHAAVEFDGPGRRPVGAVPGGRIKGLVQLAVGRQALEVGLFGVGERGDGREARAVAACPLIAGRQVGVWPAQATPENVVQSWCGRMRAWLSARAKTARPALSCPSGARWAGRGCTGRSAR